MGRKVNEIRAAVFASSIDVDAYYMVSYFTE